MSDLLFLAHRLPWPPDRGDRIRSWHMLQRLAELRRVHVVCPLDSAADRRHLDAVREVATSVMCAVRPGSKGLAVAGALLTGLPASVALFSLPSLRGHVSGLLRHGDIDTIFAFSGQMAHYVPRWATQRFIMDFVDVDSAKFEQQGAGVRGLPGIAIRHEAKRLRAFEIAAATRADASLFVSKAEATLFTARTGLPAQVIENGVDADHFSPFAVAPAEAPSPLIVFTGQMDYAPNVEAVVRFTREVLPLIEGATFAIVGRAPTAKVRSLEADNVIVTGEVVDTRPWLAAADVVVAPLLLARGIQNKVLEAMAMAKPVVASSVAAEGIDAVAGEALIIADSPAEIASAIGGLLTDRVRARLIGAAARARVQKRYSWDALLAGLEDLIEPPPRHRPGPLRLVSSNDAIGSRLRRSDA